LTLLRAEHRGGKVGETEALGDTKGDGLGDADGDTVIIATAGEGTLDREELHAEEVDSILRTAGNAISFLEVDFHSNGATIMMLSITITKLTGIVM